MSDQQPQDPPEWPERPTTVPDETRGPDPDVPEWPDREPTVEEAFKGQTEQEMRDRFER
jgi:hypothetical protein